MTEARRGLALAAGLMAAVTAAGLLLRPLMPIDETRYASVAWEMYHGGLLVPHLNGAPYADKPPLLFWLVVAGWRLFGPAAAWFRLVAPLAGLGALALGARLASRLWPGRAGPPALAPLLTAGALVWTVYGTLTLFDTLLSCAVLVALSGLWAARAGGARPWLAVAVGVSLGLFAKGPVIFLHLLPAALLAPWWMGGAAERPASWPRWYGALALAVLGGVLPVLAWAIPAARAGGPAYADAIFLGQTAGRVVNAFAHRRPLWWYLPLLPVLASPWALWPRLWRAAAALRRAPPEPGVRFCLAMTGSALALFSLVSGKQIHYLLPLVPVLAALAARALDEGGSAFRSAARLATATAAVVIGAQLAGRPVLARYDLRQAAALAADAERRGAPVAFAGRYSGQFGWLGRLRRPLAVVADSAASDWVAAHPGGVLFRQVPGVCPVAAGERILYARRLERRTLCALSRR